ncbi:MAG: hypothetical protein QOJ20_1505, partial [Mycobacterium sp.]|nr:hypothetical protein [Mycobacterium sp.]
RDAAASADEPVVEAESDEKASDDEEAMDDDSAVGEKALPLSA